MKKRVDKRGNLLPETIIFLILNLIFLGVLIGFVFTQGSNYSVYEDNTAKEIALLLDSAKPGTEIYFNLDKTASIAEDNGVDFEDIVKKNGNVITVKLHRKSEGHSYSYFNNYHVSMFPVSDNTDYIFRIREIAEEEK